MNWSVKHLHGFAIHAVDGDIGKVEDLYFDDSAWTIRYLVVNAGSWLEDRRVLVSPISVTGVDWLGHRIDVSLTCNQVKNSPDIDTHKPISRQNEITFYRYWGYPIYWGGVGLWGGGTYPGLLAQTGLARKAAGVEPEVRTAGSSTNPGQAGREPESSESAAETDNQDTHLRSTREVTGYGIHARDGEIGHVEDFVINDQTWRIDHLVIDTSNWWLGKKVIIAPTWVQAVDWADERVTVDLEREAIKNGPEFSPEALAERSHAR